MGVRSVACAEIVMGGWRHGLGLGKRGKGSIFHGNVSGLMIFGNLWGRYKL